MFIVYNSLLNIFKVQLNAWDSQSVIESKPTEIIVFCLKTYGKSQDRTAHESNYCIKVLGIINWYECFNKQCWLSDLVSKLNTAKIKIKIYSW